MYWSNIVDSHRCKKCDGRQIVPEIVEISKACPICKGEGHVDWVTYAMGRPADGQPSTSFLYDIAQRNVYMLMEEIRRQGYMVGVDFEVDIQIRDQRRWMERAYPPIMNPYIGGK